jgi:hypothetical protein
MPRFQLVIVIGLSVVMCGCTGGRYKVTGKVTYEDGTPVEAGTIIAEATINDQPVSLQGNIAKDGRFTLGSAKPGDGALPGTYQVLVLPPTLADDKIAAGELPAIDGKYGKFETSGLTLTVKPERNEFNITVSRPKPKTTPPTAGKL